MKVRMAYKVSIRGRKRSVKFHTTFGEWTWSVWGTPTGKWKDFMLHRSVKEPLMIFHQKFVFGWNGERFVLPPDMFKEKEYLDQLNPREMWECIVCAMATFNIKGHEEMEQKFYDAVAMYRGMKLCYLEED